MNENVISVKEVSVSYGEVEAIENITLDIKKGEFVCIVGPNGGGKTTFLNAVLGFLKPDKGEIKIFGKDIKKAYSKISFVPQVSSAERNFPVSVLEAVMTAGLKSGLHPFKSFNKADKKKAFELLKAVGLDGFAKREISALSGGEFQRMLIARALSQEPEILLLDEPTANADISSRNKIFSLLSELNRNGLTVVIVTHDLAAVKDRCSKLIAINRGLVFCGKLSEKTDIGAMMYGVAERGNDDV